MLEKINEALIDDLVRIGTLKNESSFGLRGYFSDLGLYVLMRCRMGMTSLKAGGKFISRIDLWQERENAPWRVKKYKPGEWEQLVKPTLALAEWIHVDKDRVNEFKRSEYKAAIARFKATGVLELPATAHEMVGDISASKNRQETYEYLERSGDIFHECTDCLAEVMIQMYKLDRSIKSLDEVEKCEHASFWIFLDSNTLAPARKVILVKSLAMFGCLSRHNTLPVADGLELHLAELINELHKAEEALYKSIIKVAHRAKICYDIALDREAIMDEVLIGKLTTAQEEFYGMVKLHGDVLKNWESIRVRLSTEGDERIAKLMARRKNSERH